MQKTDAVNITKGRGLGSPAKVRVPTPRTFIIPRPRLIELLRQHLEGRVTIVSALPGYGKTALLTEFARELDRPVCWYSLSAEDGDPAVFLRYFIFSLQQQFPGFGQGVLQGVLDEGLDNKPDRGRALLDELLAEIDCSISEPFVVVLDDLHHVDDSPETLDLLSALLQRLPDHCHLILASRTYPRLPTLPLLTARQQVGKVDAELLALDAEELSRFLVGVLHKPADEQAAHQLLEMTEGWLAALILLADGSGVAGPSAADMGSAGALAQFLEAEVWSAQPSALQQFILSTSVLQLLEPSLCERLLGNTDAQKTLAALALDNLCSVQVQGEGIAYRYHPLVRRFLGEKLRSQSPAEYVELHRRAAALYEGASQWGEAISHYGQGDAWAEVGRVLDAVAGDLLQQGRWQELLQWLEAIPSAVLESQPRTMLWQARVLHQMNQLDQALQSVHRATPLLTTLQDWSALAEALIIQATCQRRKGDYDGAIEACKKACSLLVQQGGSVATLTEARKELGITYGMSGHLDKAVQELKGVLETYETRGDSVNIAHVSDQLGTALTTMGRLSEGASHLEKAYQRWRRLANQLRQVQTLNNLGVLYYLLGEYDRAEEALREALQKAEEEGYTLLKAYILASIADVQRQCSQYKAALELYRRGLDLAHELEETYLAIYTTDGMANVHRLLGDLDKAETLIGHAFAEAEDRGGVFEMGICQISLGLIHMDKGEVKEAAACLEKATKLLAQGNAKRELAKAHFHLAEAYYRLNKKTAASECLERVASLVQELGYMHFLTSAAAAAPFLLQYAIARKMGDGFYHRLMHLLKGPTTEAENATPSEEASSLPAVEAYAFGGARVTVDGREITELEWRSEKSKEMFFYFLSHPPSCAQGRGGGGPVARSAGREVQQCLPLQPLRAAVAGTGRNRQGRHRL